MNTPKNPHAQALGRLGGLKKKPYSAEERRKRADRLAVARGKRKNLRPSE